MEAVAIEVPRRRAVRGGDHFDVFGDGGSGAIDTSTPLTDQPLAFWDGLPGRDGHLRDGHLSAMHLDNVIPDGHVSGRHLSAEHLWPAALLWFVSRPLYFGVFQFAVGSVDAVGNRSATLSDVADRVVNSSPRPASALAKGRFDGGTQQLSLTFVPSPDL